MIEYKRVAANQVTNDWKAAKESVEVWERLTTVVPGSFKSLQSLLIVIFYVLYNKFI